MSATQRYREARDLLISLRGRHEEALERFEWPDVGEEFNWGVDWFDAIARGNDEPALVVVGEDGSSEEISFDAMAARSDRVGRWLLGLGVGRGDPVLLMLGNQVELWDVMLAVMKIGAVIVPTATAAGAADLADRVARSGARAVVDHPRPDREVRRAGCRPRAGQRRRRPTGGPTCTTRTPSTSSRCRTRAPHRATRCSSTSPPARPPDRSSSSTPRCRTPWGTSRPPYWLGLRPGDRHLNLSSPGWAKHAWSCFFAPWIAESTIVVLSYARFDAGLLLDVLRRNEVTSFCAPPTVWRMLINADLSGGPGRAARGGRCGRAAEPRGHRAGAPGVGARPARRLRPDRDDRRGRQHPRVTAQARVDGPAAPRGAGGARRPADRRARRRRRGRASSASTSAPTRCR